VATLAIAGVPLFAGFFSKDAILSAVFNAHMAGPAWLPKLLWALVIFTAGLTAFYMFRMLSMTFWGEFRGGKELESHIHESPRSMTVPLMVLAVLSTFGGYIGIPFVQGGNRIGTLLSGVIPEIAGHPRPEAHHDVGLEVILMAVSVAAAGVGIFLAWRWYAKGNGAVPARLAASMPGVYRTVSNKYYFDEAYEAVVVDGLAKGGGRLLWETDAAVVDLIPNGTSRLTYAFSWISSLFDQYVVDGLVNGVGDTLAAGWRLLRRAQTGRVQNYALVMGAGLFCLVAAYLLFR
jgi:NADH-quinone oxidoreductase subunit L